MAQNEMKAMRGMPLRVRSMEGLGFALLRTRDQCCGCVGQHSPKGKKDSEPTHGTQEGLIVQLKEERCA